MLHRANELLREYRVLTADGAAVGKVSDLLFDDVAWRVCHVVVRVGGRRSREVLLPPGAFVGPDRGEKTLRSGLTGQQVGDAPAREESGAIPDANAGLGPGSRGDDRRLGSVGAILGFDVEATDGGIGHVEDLLVEPDVLVEPDGWRVRYVVVDTRGWLPGRKVLVSTDWVSGMGRRAREMRLDLLTDEIRSAPAWEGGSLPDRDYEVRLHGHYGRVPLLKERR